MLQIALFVKVQARMTDLSKVQFSSRKDLSSSKGCLQFKTWMPDAPQLPAKSAYALMAGFAFEKTPL
jgi:hypothetical protein